MKGSMKAYIASKSVKPPAPKPPASQMAMGHRKAAAMKSNTAKIHSQAKKGDR